jgi:hypothetical protein
VTGTIRSVVANSSLFLALLAELAELAELGGLGGLTELAELAFLEPLGFDTIGLLLLLLFTIVDLPDINYLFKITLQIKSTK